MPHIASTRRLLGITCLALAASLCLDVGPARAGSGKADPETFAANIHLNLPNLVEEGLKLGARLVGNRFCEEKSCLLHALNSYASETLALLIKVAKKSELNYMTSKGTVLAYLLRHRIIKPETTEVARLMLEHGASLTGKDADGFTVGELLCLRNSPELASYLGPASTAVGRYRVGDTVRVGSPSGERTRVESRCGNVYGLMVSPQPAVITPILTPFREKQLFPFEEVARVTTPAPTTPPPTPLTVTPPRPEPTPPRPATPAAGRDRTFVFYLAAIYCAGIVGENLVKVSTIRILFNDRSSQTEMTELGKPLLDRLRSERTSERPDRDGGYWCRTGHVGALELKDKSYEDFLWDMEADLRQRKAGWLPADWYHDYKFADVSAYGEVDVRR